jgi:glycerate dehydrogenase
MPDHIVFLDRGSIRAKLRQPAFAHTWRDYDNTAPEDVAARLHEATIAISNKVPMRRAVLAQLPRLKLIAVCATGTDNIDLEYCREKNISVCNIRHYARHAVPEHVFSLMLALRRNLLAYLRDVRAGAWQRAEQFCLMHHPIRDLHGEILGIIGYGELGAAVAAIATAFGMRVLIAERKDSAETRPGRTPFATVLRESDIVTLHTPLTAQTRNLIGAPELALMKPDALLINTARGGLVDEQALVAALKNGRLGGAAFDVLTEEPPRRGNPLLTLDLPNLIVTPHNAWASEEAMQIMADQLIDNIESFARGELKNRVV